jgi:hypothetical protein
MAPGSRICPTCGAAAARRCANGHPLPPGYQLCSACGAFAAEQARPAAPAQPAPGPWLYVGCGLAVVAALLVVAVLVLRSPSTTSSGPVAAAPKPAPTTATTRPPSTTATPTTPTTRRGIELDVTPERLKEELKTYGMSEKQADCLVDGLVAEGVDLGSIAAPTAEEQRILEEVATRCVSAR